MAITVFTAHGAGRCGLIPCNYGKSNAFGRLECPALATGGMRIIGCLKLCNQLFRISWPMLEVSCPSCCTCSTSTCTVASSPACRWIPTPSPYPAPLASGNLLYYRRSLRPGFQIHVSVLTREKIRLFRLPGISYVSIHFLLFPV